MTYTIVVENTGDVGLAARRPRRRQVRAADLCRWRPEQQRTGRRRELRQAGELALHLHASRSAADGTGHDRREHRLGQRHRSARQPVRGRGHRRGSRHRSGHRPGQDGQRRARCPPGRRSATSSWSRTPVRARSRPTTCSSEVDLARRHGARKPGLPDPRPDRQGGRQPGRLSSTASRPRSGATAAKEPSPSRPRTSRKWSPWVARPSVRRCR